MDNEEGQKPKQKEILNGEGNPEKNPYASFSWEADRDKVIGCFDSIKDERRGGATYLLRGAVNDLNNISFDSEGRPVLNKPVLGSQAYVEGGWNHVESRMENVVDISDVIGDVSIDEEDRSIIVHATPDPGSVIFSDDKGNGALIVISPGTDRANFTKDTLNELERLREVVKARGLFQIDKTAMLLSNQEAYLDDDYGGENDFGNGGGNFIFGEDLELPPEIVLGPFIRPDEIVAIIGFNKGDSEDFRKAFESAFSDKD